MREKTKVFKALSDPNRLRIIKMLEFRPLCVCEMTNVLQLATSTVSSHLSILREAGLIMDEKDGKWVNYMLVNIPDDKQAVKELLKGTLLWLTDEKQCADDRLKLACVDRLALCNI